MNPDTKYGESNLVPYFYLMEIIEKVCSFLGYRSGGNFLRHAELQKLLVHNNYALDKSDIAYQCYVQRNVNQTIPIGGQRINFLTENYDDGNAFDLTTDTYTIKAPGEHEVKLAVYIYDGPAQMIEVSVVCQNGTYNHVETFSYPGAVSHQFTHTFFATDADVDSSVTFYAAVRGLNNQEFIMSNSWLRVANLTSGRLNIFEQFIDMKNHVPNITAGKIGRAHV